MGLGIKNQDEFLWDLPVCFSYFLCVVVEFSCVTGVSSGTEKSATSCEAESLYPCEKDHEAAEIFEDLWAKEATLSPPKCKEIFRV